MYVTILVFMIFVGFNGFTRPSYSADSGKNLFRTALIVRKWWSYPAENS